MLLLFGLLCFDFSSFSGVLNIPSPYPPRGFIAPPSSVSCHRFTHALRFFFLHVPPACNSFFPSCNRLSFPLQLLSHSFSFCDSVGIFSCLSAGSISTLSSAKCDLFCGSSLQHNRAVFVVRPGREGAKKERLKKNERRNRDKRTKQTSRAGNSRISVCPPSFHLPNFSFF